MTATGSRAPPPTSQDTRLDGRIFGLILKGQLKETSSVADGTGEPAVLLPDHPRFSKVLQIARISRAMTILDDISWWETRTPDWQSTLANTPAPELFFRTSRRHDTGFAVVTDGETSKVIAFSAGLTVCVSSTVESERLTGVLTQSETVPGEELQRAGEHAEKQKKPLGWALLDLGLIAVDDLLAAYERQARQRIFGLFDTTRGELQFFRDDRAAQLDAVVNLPLLALLRTGMWGRREVSVENLRLLCKPILEREEKLRLRDTLGTLQFELTAAENIVVSAARNESSPSKLLAALEEQGEEALAEGLRVLYMLTQFGVIGVDAPEHAQPVLPPLDDYAVAEPDPEYGMIGLPDLSLADGTAPRRMTGRSYLEEYKLQLKLEEEGRSFLKAKQYEDAFAKFRQLADRQDRPVQAFAYVSVSMLLAKVPDAKNRALDYARRAVELDREDAIARAALSRALEAMGSPGARSQAKQAMALSEHNDAWYAEVISLLEIGKRTRAQQRRVDMLRLGVTLLLALAVMLGLFLYGNVMLHGRREYFYSGTDPFFYYRRGALILFGLIGLAIGCRVKILRLIKELGWRVGPWVVAGLLWGAAIGFLSPPQRVTGLWWTVGLLTLLHVVAEEIFFRGFLTRLLLEKIGEPLQAIFLSGLIFALYHLTLYSFWHETALIPKFYWCAVVGVFAGVPYAFLYYKTKGILVPIICHATVNGIMMGFSLFGGKAG